MASTKISALTALGASPADGDLFPIVDISDTGMAPSGTDKKVTWLELKQGLISGTTNRATMFTGANSIGNSTWEFSGNDYRPVTAGSAIGASGNEIQMLWMGPGGSQINSVGQFNLTRVAGTLAMRMESTGEISFGQVVPSYVHPDTTAATIHVGEPSGGPATDHLRFSPLKISMDNGTTSTMWYISASTGIIGTYSNHNFNIYTNNLERIRVENDGDVGIGVTPTVKFHIKGTGNTSATNSFLVENSDGDDLMLIRDDGRVALKGLTGEIYLSSVNLDLKIANSAGDALRILPFSTDIYMDNTSTGLFRYRINSSQEMTLSSTGLALGVNVEAETRLDVAGTAQMRRGANATGGMQLVNSQPLQFQAAYWTGAASANRSMKIKNVMDSTTPTYHLSLLDNGDVERLHLSDTGNMGLNTASFGTSAQGVLAIGNGSTEVSTAIANGVQIYAVDSDDATSTLGLRLEQAVEAIGTFTESHKIKVKINGTLYWISLDAV